MLPLLTLFLRRLEQLGKVPGAQSPDFAKGKRGYSRLSFVSSLFPTISTPTTHDVQDKKSMFTFEEEEADAQNACSRGRGCLRPRRAGDRRNLPAPWTQASRCLLLGSLLELNARNYFYPITAIKASSETCAKNTSLGSSHPMGALGLLVICV